MAGLKVSEAQNDLVRQASNLLKVGGIDAIGMLNQNKGRFEFFLNGKEDGKKILALSLNCTSRVLEGHEGSRQIPAQTISRIRGACVLRGFSVTGLNGANSSSRH